MVGIASSSSSLTASLVVGPEADLLLLVVGPEGLVAGFLLSALRLVQKVFTGDERLEAIAVLGPGDNLTHLSPAPPVVVVAAAVVPELEAWHGHAEGVDVDVAEGGGLEAIIVACEHRI